MANFYERIFMAQEICKCQWCDQNFRYLSGYDNYRDRVYSQAYQFYSQKCWTEAGKPIQS